AIGDAPQVPLLHAQRESHRFQVADDPLAVELGEVNACRDEPVAARAQLREFLAFLTAQFGRGSARSALVEKNPVPVDDDVADVRLGYQLLGVVETYFARAAV